MIPHGTPVWFCTSPVDLRKGFNGLVGLVANQFNLNVLDGACFLFVNVQRTSAKALYWDGTGLCVLSKRLAKGKFASIRHNTGDGRVGLTEAEARRFLHGFSPEFQQ